MKDNGARYTAIVIDDEPNALAVLLKLIKAHCPQVEVVAFLSNSKDGLEKIKLLNPSIVFLDIAMPDMDSFQLLSNLKEINFHLIFTTAYDQLPIKAFQFNAVDYLLKPIDAEELKKAIQKVAAKSFSFSQQLQHIKEIFLEAEKDHLPERIAFPHARGYKFVALKDIIYCESESNFTILHLVGEPTFTVCKTLGEMEKILAQNHFVRIHRSYLVNTKRIKEFVKCDGGFLIMEDHFKIPVSRHKREELREILKPK